jgi:hypothetical protein
MSQIIETEKSVHFEVSFGPTKESQREIKTFTDEAHAIEFFKKKDKAGMHIDAYEVNTVTTRKKLSA